MDSNQSERLLSILNDISNQLKEIKEEQKKFNKLRLIEMATQYEDIKFVKKSIGEAFGFDSVEKELVDNIY